MPKCTNPKFPHIFTVNATAKKQGVLTAIRDTDAFTLHKVLADPQGQYLILICDINSTTYTVVNIYAPNKHQSHFLHQVLKKNPPGSKRLPPALWRLQSSPGPQDGLYYTIQQAPVLATTTAVYL